MSKKTTTKKKSARKSAKPKVAEKEDFMTRWEKKSPEDKRWNLLQIGWMVGAIIIALGFLTNTTAAAFTLAGGAVILVCLKELNKMKGRGK